MVPAAILVAVVTIAAALWAPGRTASATGSGPNFSNLTLPPPSLTTPVVGFISKDGEPSIRAANDGGIYVAAPIGGPAGGCDFWTVQSNGPTAAFKGRSDNNVGGGDCDLATSKTASTLPLGNQDIVAASSLQIGSGITTTSSYDGGNTFVSNPEGSATPATDRMWNAAGTKSNPLEFFMTFKQAPGSGEIVVQKSEDGGLSYTDTVPPLVQAGHEGNIVVSDDGQGIYIPYTDAINETSVNLLASHDGGTTWTQSVIDSDPTLTFGHLFPSIALDPDNHTLYVAYSDEHHVHLATAASDSGPWTKQVVPTLDSTQTNVFPWIASGKTGQADIVWYGTADATETATSAWNTYFARYTNSANPVVSRVSVKSNHTGFICENGSGCSGTAGTSGDRSMLDFIQVADDANGLAHVAWTADNPGNSNEPTVIVYGQEQPGTVQSPPSSSPSAGSTGSPSPSPVSSPTPCANHGGNSPKGNGGGGNGRGSTSCTGSSPSPSPLPSPSASPSASPSSSPSPVACAPLYTSPSGDAPNTALPDTSPGPNVDELDLTAGYFGNTTATGFTARMVVKNLGATPPTNATSENWYAQFTYGGVDYFAGATEDLVQGGVSYQVGTYSNNLYQGATTVSGNFDVAHSRIDIFVPLAAITSGGSTAPGTGATLTNTYASTWIGQGVAGNGSIHEIDRSPRNASVSVTSDTSVGAPWTVGTGCPLN